MAEIWTVRGVPEEVQKAASEAARAAGMKLGPWVAMAVQKALASGVAETDARHTAPDGELAELRATVAELVQRVDEIDTREIDLSKRVDALKGAGMAKAAPTAEPDGDAETKPIRAVGGPHRKIPDEHLEEAANLYAQGLSLPKIIEQKGWPHQAKSLAQALDRRRKKQAAERP